jgi:hypothetical protein
VLIAGTNYACALSPKPKFVSEETAMYKNAESGPRKTYGNQQLLSLTSVAMLLVTAGMSANSLSVQAMDVVDISVFFDELKCPVRVGDEYSEATSPQKLRWTAYSAGDGGERLTDVSYDIFFDPFVGASLTDSNSNGVVTSKPVDPKAPVGVDYKYTIVGSECLDHPLDPYIVLW